MCTHFDKSEPEATCKLCQKKIKLYGNTTNFREHLKIIHLIDNENAKPYTSSSPATEEAVGEYGGKKKQADTIIFSTNYKSFKSDATRD